MNKKLQELISQLVREEISLNEKKAKKEEPAEDIDINLEEPAAPTEEPTMGPEDSGVDSPPADVNMGGGSSIEKQIGQGLQMALEAAKGLPDSENKDKLVRQIGNTALFFLKSQIQSGTEQV